MAGTAVRYARGLAAVSVDGSVRNFARSQPSDKAHLDDTASLSPGELKILQLVDLGYSNSDIARALDISSNTVRAQLAQAASRLGVKTRKELVEKYRQSYMIGVSDVAREPALTKDAGAKQPAPSEKREATTKGENSTK